MTVGQPSLAKPVMRFLITIARTAGQPERFIPYQPARWLEQQPTGRNRQRWSRWTRRLTNDGWLRRKAEPSRDRVHSVAVTAAGWERLIELCGEAALVDLFALEWKS